MIENIFTELKAKMAEQKRVDKITELDGQLARCNRALSLTRQIIRLQESELLKHKIMEAGYSEGE